jgi:outer membrane lipoprotein-sorting protein
MKLIVTFLLLCSFLLGDEATDIIQKLDANMRGETLYLKLEMRVLSGTHQRSMKMQSWSEGSKKSFVKITYPPKERGITFLSLDNQMWQYVPRIERIIKIPPSMMLQQWMGSDITNDDMVKQSSLVEDYTAKLLDKKGHIVTIELTPKPDAAVVWGKIISTIDTNTYTSQKDIYYDESGEAVREFSYENVKKTGKYYIPTLWRVKPLNTKEHRYTEIVIESVTFDGAMPDGIFGKSALKRYSR